MDSSVSIIICTRNRADVLQRTLESIAQTEVPPQTILELIVVDNDSTDATRRVVEQTHLPFPVKYAFEAQRGTAHARNRALAVAQHDVLLWTDDDVLVPHEWIQPMIAPILQGRGDVVAGGVRLAPHLRKAWLEPWHQSLFASTEFRLNEESLSDAVGANMAFGRHVLVDVPEFDPELGAGGVGYCEESHFVERLARLGYRVVPAFHVEVEHHFDPKRLDRPSFASQLQRLGRSQAYIHYHWRHENEAVFGKSPARTWGRIVFLEAKLFAKRLWHAPLPKEGMQAWEGYYLQRIAYLRQSLIERRRPRRYDKYAPRRRAEDRGAIVPPTADVPVPAEPTA